MNPRSWTAVAALGDGPAAPPFTNAAVIAGCGIGQSIDGGGTVAVEFIAIPAAFIRSLCRWIISRTRGCAASLGSNPMSSSWCLRRTSTVSDLRVASCSCCWRIACTRAGCSEVISAGISVAPTAASRSLAAAVSSRCRWSISASLCPWSLVPECSVSAWIRLAFVSATAATPVRMRSVIVPIMPPRAWSIMFVSERGRILLLAVVVAVAVVVVWWWWWWCCRRRRSRRPWWTASAFRRPRLASASALGGERGRRRGARWRTNPPGCWEGCPRVRASARRACCADRPAVWTVAWRAR